MCLRHVIRANKEMPIEYIYIYIYIYIYLVASKHIQLALFKG